MGPMFSYPLTERSDCAAGDHHWRATSKTGISMCVTCGVYAYCVFCIGVLPAPSCLRPCSWHRHSSPKVHDVLSRRKDLLQ